LSEATRREWVYDGAPERLDRALAGAWSDLSRSRLQALIRDGRVAVNGAAIVDPNQKLSAGAAVTLDLPAAIAPEPRGEAIALHVVFEDDELIVLDKPAGLVVHPAAGHETGTLVNALIAHCGDSLSGIGGVKRPGIVHRLDKDTSGLLVVAKTDRAHQSLAEQFADHGRTGSLERAYCALVWGVPERRRGTIAAALGRSSHNREKMAVVSVERGRHAITHYELEETLPPRSPEAIASLVRCQLETGRTHQIRVHLAHIGHPLLGDAVYGSGFKTKANRLSDLQRAALAALGRQALHAAILGFEHPRTGENLRFESPLPEDMATLLETLRR
jgi:23S rRNA pseudouridine1911/1915/1917 synthase